MTLERWKTISMRDQLGHIASEIMRAELNRNKDKAVYLATLEKAIEFVDLSLNDPKWRENPLPLLVLRDELAKAYLMSEGVSLAELYAAI